MKYYSWNHHMRLYTDDCCLFRATRYVQFESETINIQKTFIDTNIIIKIPFETQSIFEWNS